MNERTSSEAIDDDATRAQARTILERAEQAEREQRARYCRPLDFSGRDQVLKA